MSAEEIVRWLRDSLPPKIDYAELVCAEGFAHGQHYVWDDPLPYLIEQAADLIDSQAAEIARLNDEPPAYRFYYCESEDSYLLGRRMDTLYYAHWHEPIGFVWDMSRYLPWAATIDGRERGCAWGVHTYPSEPAEISPSEWFKGFLAQRLTASQQETRAARNELCVKCGRYHEAHKGACDGCRWKEN